VKTRVYGTLSPLGVQMGVWTTKTTKMTSKITKILLMFSRNLGRVLIPALTTRFQTKQWAAFRHVFLCFLEPCLQAEYQRTVNCVCSFASVGGSASHINIHSKTKTDGRRSALSCLLVGVRFDRQCTGLIEIAMDIAPRTSLANAMGGTKEL